MTGSIHCNRAAAIVSLKKVPGDGDVAHREACGSGVGDRNGLWTADGLQWLLGKGECCGAHGHGCLRYAAQQRNLPDPSTVRADAQKSATRNRRSQPHRWSHRQAATQNIPALPPPGFTICNIIGYEYTPVRSNIDYARIVWIDQDIV